MYYIDNEKEVSVEVISKWGIAYDGKNYFNSDVFNCKYSFYLNNSNVLKLVDVEKIEVTSKPDEVIFNEVSVETKVVKTRKTKKTEE